MHPMLILLSAITGVTPRRLGGGLVTATAALAVVGVALALLLPGSFGGVAAPSEEPVTAVAGTTGGGEPSSGGEVEQGEVRVSDWSYSKKPISPATVGPGRGGPRR
jgi:hypothetical protein